MPGPGPQRPWREPGPGETPRFGRAFFFVGGGGGVGLGFLGFGGGGLGLKFLGFSGV